ncbi:hypothetical protein FACS1894172_06120 [Spirochaetia bacterium]|nr:hypothetical protein FACS1894164_04840 [Spirochaetia bacterium]GHU31354.1 hypothetical protein FACS1894172_06120 [Spirochaetia bacterium]
MNKQRALVFLVLALVITDYVHSQSAGLYVGDTLTDVPFQGRGGILARSLAWINENAVDNGVYTIRLNTGETILAMNVAAPHEAENVSITITTVGIKEVVISVYLAMDMGRDSGAPFSLTLGGHTTLRGISEGPVPMVNVYATCNLTMSGNAKITGTSADLSSVVYIDGGTFTMTDDASISGNSAAAGGGVYVADGIFTMSGNASVSGNSAEYGGGVYVCGGTFTMSDNAYISYNSAEYGGGVYVFEGTFTMNDNASVSDNSAAKSGGGLIVDNGTFSMNGEASVSNNHYYGEE